MSREGADAGEGGESKTTCSCTFVLRMGSPKQETVQRMIIDVGQKEGGREREVEECACVLCIWANNNCKV